MTSDRVPHPSGTLQLHGHREAEARVVQAYSSGRMPHAWLLTGPQGIGKATLAYRIARFLLSHDPIDPEESGASLFGEADALPQLVTSLDVPEGHPVIRRMEQGSHGDLFVLEPTHLDEHGKEKAGYEMRIWQVRELGKFLSQTAAESQWRVVIIDSVDDMNSNAANALLKALEEPPERTVMLLVSHCPGRLLPTIRSRCRVLPLQPLAQDEVRRLLEATVEDGMVDMVQSDFAAMVAAGSPGLAVEIYQQGGLAMYREIVGLLQTLPQLDIPAMQGLAAQVSAKGNEAGWRMFSVMLGFFLAKTVEYAVMQEAQPEFAEEEQALKTSLTMHYSVDQLTEIWEKVGQTVAQGDGLNMSRQHTATQVFALLHS